MSTLRNSVAFIAHLIENFQTLEFDHNYSIWCLAVSDKDEETKYKDIHKITVGIPKFKHSVVIYNIGGCLHPQFVFIDNICYDISVITSMIQQFCD